MSDDAEIFKAATRLIEQHGESAAAVAALHFETVREKGDTYSAGQWSRILAMIEKLQDRCSTDSADG
jgi:hypothetical protein